MENSDNKHLIPTNLSFESLKKLNQYGIYPFHLKDPKANRFKSSQIEEKNEVNIKLILTSFFCSILERFQFDFLGWL
jgi:hypothetical protein